MLIRAKSCCCVLIAITSLFGISGVAIADNTAAILRTPKAPESPRINGARIYGIRPGKPFLYRIPCTGNRPIHFAAKKLPASLKLDSASGIISGRAPEKPGEYGIKLTASNPEGKVSRAFKIVVGNQIGLTPQMGWNSWYIYHAHVTDGAIRKAADAMVASGMADYGYQYISIDDGWATKPGSKDPALNGPARNPSGAILPNRHFPDMHALTDYIHSKGLKAGIYTSPGPETCARAEGSYQHEETDARQFSAWGFDLLKYDWCSYTKVAGGKTLDDYEKPYRKMGNILKGVDRDVALNMCQYGMADVWKWGREVGGNSWRTTGDLGSMKATDLPGFYRIGFSNAGHSEYAGPGGWNDPDYLLIGKIGTHGEEGGVQRAGLTPDEEYSYMSMWSLMAAPLFYSGDMEALDSLTLNVLCNAEVIDIDQDPLGKQGKVIRKTAQEFILAKPLEDGSLALGLFNLSPAPLAIPIKWSDLGLQGEQRIRDVWRQHDLGSFKSNFSPQVPSHGVILLRLTPRHIL